MAILKRFIVTVRYNYGNAKLSKFFTMFEILNTEILGYIAATLTTASFLPQAILTIRTRDTEALSLSMYSTFTLGVFCWLIYGIYLANNVIIYANAITLFLALVILSFKIYNSFFKHNEVKNHDGHSN